MAEYKYMWIPADMKKMSAEFGYWHEGQFFPQKELSAKEVDEFERNPDYQPGLAEKYYY